MNVIKSKTKLMIRKYKKVINHLKWIHDFRVLKELVSLIKEPIIAEKLQRMRDVSEDQIREKY